MRHLILILALMGVGATATQSLADGEQLVHTVHFTDYEAGPIDDWLAGKGFKSNSMQSAATLSISMSVTTVLRSKPSVAPSACWRTSR